MPTWLPQVSYSFEHKLWLRTQCMVDLFRPKLSSRALSPLSPCPPSSGTRLDAFLQFAHSLITTANFPGGAAPQAPDTGQAVLAPTPGPHGGGTCGTALLHPSPRAQGTSGKQEKEFWGADTLLSPWSLPSARWHFVSPSTSAAKGPLDMANAIFTGVLLLAPSACVCTLASRCPVPSFQAFCPSRAFLPCGTALMPPNPALLCRQGSRRVLFQSILRVSPLTMTNLGLLPLLRPHSAS